jgi:integrase
VEKVETGLYRFVGTRTYRGVLHVDGRRTSRNFEASSDRKARDQYAALKTHTGERKEVVASTDTLRDLGLAYIESLEALVASGERSSSRTAENARQRLKHLGPLLDRKVQSLTTSSIENWLSEKRRSGLAPSTIASVYTLLKRLLASAVKKKLIAANPCEDVEHPPRAVVQNEPVVLLDDAVARLLGNVSPRFLIPVMLLADAGLRASECCGLIWDDIDFDAGVIRIRAQLTRGKDAKRVALKTPSAVREVPLSPPMLAALREHRQEAFGFGLAKAEDFVCATASGQPVSQRNLHRAIASAARRAGLGKIGAHDLRHSYGSRLVSKGVPIPTVSRWLGHSNSAFTLKVYVHEYNSHEADEAARAKAYDGAEERLGQSGPKLVAIAGGRS